MNIMSMSFLGAFFFESLFKWKSIIFFKKTSEIAGEGTRFLVSS